MYSLFFFFQAEDGIRDVAVTGVQTCALPILGTKQFLDRPMKDLLVVLGDEVERQRMVEFIGNGDVTTTAIATGGEALGALRGRSFDCVVVEAGLPDMSGLEVVEALLKEPSAARLPIAGYSAAEVLSAENGRDAIGVLRRVVDIDVVLMDIMLPELDGYDTTRAIRDIDGFQRLPIIALTAKAMRGDREKCIEAGASDYVAKPVETERLLSTLRLWLTH